VFHVPSNKDFFEAICTVKIKKNDHQQEANVVATVELQTFFLSNKLPFPANHTFSLAHS